MKPKRVGKIDFGLIKAQKLVEDNINSNTACNSF